MSDTLERTNFILKDESSRIQQEILSLTQFRTDSIGSLSITSRNICLNDLMVGIPGKQRVLEGVFYDLLRQATKTFTREEFARTRTEWVNEVDSITNPDGAIGYYRISILSDTQRIAELEAEVARLTELLEPKPQVENR